MLPRRLVHPAVDVDFARGGRGGEGGRGWLGVLRRGVLGSEPFGREDGRCGQQEGRAERERTRVHDGPVVVVIRLSVTT